MFDRISRRNRNAMNVFLSKRHLVFTWKFLSLMNTSTICKNVLFGFRCLRNLNSNWTTLVKWWEVTKQSRFIFLLFFDSIIYLSSWTFLSLFELWNLLCLLNHFFIWTIQIIAHNTFPAGQWRSSKFWFIAF